MLQQSTDLFWFFSCISFLSPRKGFSVFLFLLRSLYHSQDGEVRISVSVYFPERSMPCIAILTYYHHWSLKYRSSTLREKLLGRGWKLRRHRRQKGSSTFVRACIQISAGTASSCSVLQTSSFWMPPCLQGIRVVWFWLLIFNITIMIILEGSVLCPPVEPVHFL